MPLWVATTTTARPPRNMPVRQAGHGRAGWRRATRTTPHRYPAAATAVSPETMGANCQTVTMAFNPNGGSMRPPSTVSLLAGPDTPRSEEHTSELQSLRHLGCRLLLEK